MLGRGINLACCSSIAVALCAALPPGIARAWIEPASVAAAPDIDRAKAELARGQRLYDEARHDEALLAFEAAWQAYPLPEFQYDIGLCHERLGNVEAAIAAFEAYLAAKPDAADRPSVEHRIGLLRARLPAPAAVVPDAPAEVVPPPSVAPRPTRATTPPLVDDPPKRGQPLVTGGAVALVLGLGLAVGGGVGFGLPAARRVRKLDAALDPQAPYDDRLTPAQARRTAREGDRLLALQLASIGVGAVLVGTGIGLLVAGKRRATRGRLQAGIAPSRTGVAITAGVRW